MFESSFREEKPLHIYVPKKNIELFQLRFRELFGLHDKEPIEAGDFFLRYLCVEIDTTLVKYVKIHALEDQEIVHIGKYEILAKENKHFRGSLSYKFVSTKFKLLEGQLEKFNIERGPILTRIQKESEIVLNDITIRVEDIFSIKQTILGYSGDTQVAIDVLEWMNDCTHLIHESTYFEDDEQYHTDSHSSLADLLPIISSFQNLKVFLPVHFSGRYKWEEIETEISKNQENFSNKEIFAPRLGTVLYFDDKEEKTVIENLELFEKY